LICINFIFFNLRNMPVLLRIDCDNGYIPLGNFVKKKIKLLLNYLNENYWAPHIQALGYLDHLRMFINYLIERGIKASIFFKYTTIPIHAYCRELLRYGFELGLHLFSATTYNEFLIEKRRIEKNLKVEINGFTKHGNGFVKLSRKHAWKYEPEKYIRWGVNAGLKYFSGNLHSVATKIEIVDKDFVYMPFVFYVEPWRRNTDIKNAIDLANSDFPVVALIHPKNWVLFDDAREEFEKILSLSDEILTLIDAIHKHKCKWSKNYNIKNSSKDYHHI